MRAMWSFRSAACMVVLLVLLGVSPQAFSQNNLLLNSSFEWAGAAQDKAAFWEDNATTGGVWGVARRSTWQKYDGTNAMAIPGSWGGYNYGGCWQSRPVSPSVSYTVSGYFYKDTGWTSVYTRLIVEWYNGAGTRVGATTNAVTGLLDGAWLKKSFAQTSPTNAAVAHLVLDVSGTGTNGTMYMDYAYLGSGAAVDATASIDVSADNKAISAYLYGINIANWCQWYYLNLCVPMLTNAKVSVVRYGATNIERYNYANNKMFNVHTRENQYVPMSWESFVDWCIDDVHCDPFVQISGYGHVAGSGTNVNDSNYNYNQTLADIGSWIGSAGPYVKFWGIGNEPFIGWKRGDYPGNYGDAAHGDQVLNRDTALSNYFARFASVANQIKTANTNTFVIGPTPCNWWLYWSNDQSPYCPVTTTNGAAQTNAVGWQVMMAATNQWNRSVFPDRGGDPAVTGWEQDTNRVLCQYAIRMNKAQTQYGRRVADSMDVHRYMNCWTDKDAINEPRGLWEDTYPSWDQETGCSGTQTKLLKRFQNIVNSNYPGTDLTLSEYDFFYWNGHPSISQIAAVGQMDFLGYFAKAGVKLACNWYVGEPDQSGSGYQHASDSAKQAMFNELGQPNPKYWAFWMMSQYFRGTCVRANPGWTNTLSVHAARNTNAHEVAVFAANKGDYDAAGVFITNQSTKRVRFSVANTGTNLVMKKVLRFGLGDPYPVPMQLTIATVASNQFACDLYPLAVYAFILSDNGTTQGPTSYLHVNPSAVNFGPYATGREIANGVTNYTHSIKISNARNGSTAWTITKNASWLTVSRSSGTAYVTDESFLTVSRTGLAYGVYATTVTVATAVGTSAVPVTVEVIPGETNGEKRLCDFDTGSLAHTWNISEPYSIGWWDGHGNPEDMNGPHIYRFYMDTAEKSPFGGLASMKIAFDRRNGETGDGKLYLPFGTYGHKTVIDGVTSGVACAQWSGYNSLQFDIKTKTDGSGFTKTKFLMVISDEDGHKGKPKMNGSDYRSLIEVEDGKWQTVVVPLTNVFYNWAYPSGQNGSVVTMNWSRISQIEFCPWMSYEDKSGVLYLDNVRLVRTNAAGNQFPFAAATQDKKIAGLSEVVTLGSTGSYDPDGSIASYQWSPTNNLSSSTAASPTFSSATPGTYAYNLTVTDNLGLKSRNPAQVVIKVMPALVGSSMQFYWNASLSNLLSGTVTNGIDLYVKLTCSSGGNSNEADFTMATVTSGDTYAGDTNNNVNAIQILLVETSANSRVFTGHAKMAAFSNSDKEEIGVSEGKTVKIACAGVTNTVTMGPQTFGLLRWVDRAETDLYQPNHYEGFWCSYNDVPNGNLSEAYINYDATAAHSNSTKCVKGDITLHLSGGGLDQLFGGIAAKLSPLMDGVSNAYIDIRPSQTWIKGVSFWMKGNGTKVSVVLKSAAVHDYDDYVYTIEHTPTTWRKYFLPLKDFFHQEGWGAGVPLEDAMSKVESIQFKAASKTDGQWTQIYVDDLAFFGGYNWYVGPYCKASVRTNNSFESVGDWTKWNASGCTFTDATNTDCAEGLCSIKLATTNAGYFIGMYLPGTTTNQGVPSLWNLAGVDGIAIKAKRPSGWLSSGTAPTRIRLLVSNSSADYDFSSPGVTRWQTVDCSEWSDYVCFPKVRFYTPETVDLACPTNGPIPWVTWSGSWTNARKFRIEFGSNSSTGKPYAVQLDDVMTFKDAADEYPCPW